MNETLSEGEPLSETGRGAEIVSPVLTPVDSGLDVINQEN